MFSFPDHTQISPPELLADTQDRFEVDMNSAVVLQCKCRSSTKPTIKWFKQKAATKIGENEDSEPHMEIKYYENFYQPLKQVGLKLLDDNVYLSKLTISNVTEEISVYVCVSLNYSHKISFRNFTIFSKRRKSIEDFLLDNEDEHEELEINLTNHDDRSFELFFIPLIFFLIVIIQVSAIIYLLIYRRLMKNTNKNVIIA